MRTFRSILVDIDATATAHPAFNDACDLATRFGARLTLVDVMPELPRRAQNVFTRKLQDELVEHRRVALATLARTRSDVVIDTAVLRGKPAIALVVGILSINDILLAAGAGKAIGTEEVVETLQAICAHSLVPGVVAA